MTMTPDERDLLTQSIKLAEENNKILRGIRRGNRFSTLLRIVYWVIIIASAYSAYYFLQPYIDAGVKSYNSLKENVDSVKTATSKLPALPTWLGGKE